MRLSTQATFAAIATIAAVTTGCSNSTDNTESPSTTARSAATTTHSSTAVASPAPSATTVVKLIGPSPAPLPAPSPTHPAAPAPAPLTDVDCGPVTGSNGATADVIAFASDAGRAGCTDALTVATDYVGGTRTGDAATVDGWTCQPQPDTTIPHVCFSDGLHIGLRGAAAPATPPASAPSVIRTPTPNSTPHPVEATEPPAPGPTVDDVNCGSVTDAGGATVHVIAVGTAAGRVGCTDALTVATDYANTIAPSGTVTVDGWNCQAATCHKDGLTIGLRDN
ncbi:hypothetical protein L618_004500000110 [Rhodococcus rhodochrous J45]|uniref:Uncharacterized protein n=1 Tax=Rhodococcus rhodochrous J45 TaxID=935266 RepID=A0A562DKQ0_RHORH|nr:hypothetical protein [Rhodococcus rhodochrous]TWH10107.1 hypothetical protein L618_004500000110 [Rhodococcus rhodochrous J45]